MAKYKTKFYGGYKLEGNVSEYLVTYLNRFFHERGITLTGVMLIVGTCERDAYYMVIYNDYMTKHYARDVRELENVRNKFKECKVIMDILDTLPVL